MIIIDQILLDKTAPGSTCDCLTPDPVTDVMELTLALGWDLVLPSPMLLLYNLILRAICDGLSGGALRGYIQGDCQLFWARAMRYADSHEIRKMDCLEQSYYPIYGKPVVYTAPGLADAFVNLGLLSQTKSNGIQSLDFPTKFALPEQHLYLPEVTLLTIEEHRNNLDL